MNNISNAYAKNVWRQSSPWFIVQTVKKCEILFGYQTENEFDVEFSYGQFFN